MAKETAKERILALIAERGLISAGDVEEMGIHTQALTRVVAEGVLERVAHGRYRLTDQPMTEHHNLALAAAAAPRGVICLFSALNFHQLGTQLPHQVWLALDRRARRPAIEYPPLKVVRFSKEALSTGVETHRIEGQPVQIFTIAKTIADCFKYRNKIGLDVALEALKEGWRDHRFKMADLERFMEICRMSQVMRPYLEAVVF